MQWILGGLTALLCSTVVHAADATLPECDTTKSVDKRIVFVNGIQVETAVVARDSLQRMREITCTSANHTATKQNFSFSLVYNPTGWTTLPNDTTESTVKQDLKELFMLKTHEENIRADLEFLRQYGGWTLDTTDADYQAAAHRIAVYSDHIAHMLTSLEQSGDSVACSKDIYDSSSSTCSAFSNTRSLAPGDMFPTENAINSLKAEIASGQVILVGHSEGNLLVDIAYAKAVDADVARRKMVRIVNVANTAAVSMNNFNLTHADDTALFNPIGSLTNLADRMDWNRQTNSCGWSDCDFVLAPATFQYATGIMSGCNPLVSVAECTEHLLVETYLSSDYTTEVKGDTLGVNYTPGKNAFSDRFEDLLYAAAASLDAANPQTPPLTSFLYTDFSDSPSGVAPWWPGPYYDSNAHAYVVAGTNGFTVTLPPNQTIVQLNVHMMFVATSDLPNRYAFKMYPSDGSTVGGFYFSMRHSDGCGTSLNSAYSMDGSSGSWQCGLEIPVDMNRLVNYGWVTFQAQFDQRDCTMRISITPDGNSFSMGGTVNLSAAQCAARGNFSFSPGAWNNNASLLFDRLSVGVYKQP